MHTISFAYLARPILHPMRCSHALARIKDQARSILMGTYVLVRDDAAAASLELKAENFEKSECLDLATEVIFYDEESFALEISEFVNTTFEI